MARDVAALLAETIVASAAVPDLLAPAKYPPGAEFDAASFCIAANSLTGHWPCAKPLPERLASAALLPDNQGA
jgi:hypothetical protein